MQGPQLDNWQRRRSVENPHVAFVAMSADLNHLRSDLVYYAGSDEGGYFGALNSSFSADEREAIEAIRKRAEPFGSARYY
jgi:hypothetical protein